MSNKIQSILLGGGCFWCIEAVYLRVNGVTGVRSGYAGGHQENPSYERVCSGRTGHAEVVEVSFDAEMVSLQDILRLFWQAHDPTTPNRQGNDMGPQYRSAIFYTEEEQLPVITESIKALDASGKYEREVVTEVKPLDIFYSAEAYHQEYYDQNRNQPYCRVVIEPKLQKLFSSKQ